MMKKISKVLVVAMLVTSINYTLMSVPSGISASTTVAYPVDVASGSAVEATSGTAVAATPAPKATSRPSRISVQFIGSRYKKSTNYSKSDIYLYRSTKYYYNYEINKYVIENCPLSEEESDKDISYRGKKFKNLDKLRIFAEKQWKKYEPTYIRYWEDKTRHFKYSDDATGLDADIDVDDFSFDFSVRGCVMYNLPVKTGTKVTFKLTGKKKGCSAIVDIEGDDEEAYKRAYNHKNHNDAPRIRATRIHKNKKSKYINKVFKSIYTMERWEKKTGNKVTSYRVFEETATIDIEGYGTYKVKMLNASSKGTSVGLRYK